MNGSIKGQVNFLMSLVFKHGESKHKAKSEVRSQGLKDWHSIGKSLDIYSFGTKDRYFEVWKELGDFMKSQSIKSFDKLTNEVLKDFIDSKIKSGLEKQTLRTTISALEKLEVALNKYRETHKPELKTFNFKDVLDSARQQVREIKSELKVRAYKNPESIVKTIKDKDFQVVANIQYKSGARIHEVAVIKPEQLKGYKRDIDNQTKGVISIEGKGGKVRELLVPIKDYNYIKDKIERQGVWEIDKKSYRAELKRACESIGEEYKGSHGLRWNYAEERLKTQTEYTKDPNVALGEVSKDMGHDRADITLHYLKR